MARLILRGVVVRKPDPYEYSAFGDRPGGVSYSVQVREDGNDAGAALKLRVTKDQYDALSAGDVVEVPVFADADLRESRDGRSFARLSVGADRDYDPARVHAHSA